MSILVEVWAMELGEQLRPNNSIVEHVINDDKYAEASKVTLPIAGADPDVLLDNTTYPLVPVQQVDTIVEYGVSKLETVPTVIVGLEELDLSYDKRSSVLSKHAKSLNTKAATYCINKWSPPGTITDRVIRTTGNSRPAIVKGATGNRKLIELDNIIDIAGLMDDMDVDEAGRIAFFPSKMKNDLMRISDIRKKESYGIETLPSGIVSAIMGFKIMYRSEAAVYNNAVQPISINLLTGSVAADSNAGALFYHPDFLRKGFYDVQVNIGQPDPVYSGGQTINAIMKLGGSPSYSDYLGAIALVEDVFV